ncbi:SDR family NAD(P)-dependent oxidoreductase [Paenibacillus sp. LMG 31458]|uniref:SDR family NAD(P)-dependent oxidoreductase n=1 Tax=Paenibacillus phytorum TaxID=2654977 RepID=A0ABX1Y0U9_9BACL|nr:SDR family NAD(P)-dependent oxidoreductase [Paenibacillus phytorum]NOU74462.1 SDR family NAD(P)-dependent oxidoreductase [Paenibacillus phytorum]
MNKVVVLGATGTIGKVIVKDLVESGVEVVAADLDQARLDELAAWVGKGVTTVTLNIRDFEASKDVLRQGKVCVNATNYVFNLDAMKAASAVGVSVLDLGGLFKYTNEQLKLDAQMKEANVLSITGMGSDPGTSNVFCRYGVNLLDTADEIHIRYGSTSSGTTFAFAADTIIDEAVKPAIAVKNGELVEIAPLADEEFTHFHEDLGIQKTYSIIHSELATLPSSFPQVKEITYKDTWDPATIEKIKMLEELALVDTNELEDGTVPRRQLVSLLTKVLAKKEKPVWGVDSLLVEIKGIKNGNSTTVRLELLTRYHQDWAVSPTQYATAIPASIAAQMLLKGEITEKGVQPPELCVDPETYISYLKNKNVELYITISETKKQ